MIAVLLAAARNTYIVMEGERMTKTNPIYRGGDWDSLTLKNMPTAMIEQCEERGLDWAEMGLYAREVEPAQTRDKDKDVAKIKKQLSNQHSWVALDEEGKRIQTVLAGVDRDHERDAFAAWEEHLGEKLTFPFEAQVAEVQERGPLRGDDQVIATGFSNVTDDLLPPEMGIEYPRCIAGERACPPEDVGGVWGYHDFLQAFRNPKHPEHAELLEWVGKKFDPDRFDLEGVNGMLKLYPAWSDAE